MPVNKPILSVQPSSSRLRNKQFILRRAAEIPPTTYFRKDDNNVLEVVDQTPSSLGRVCYYRESNSTSITTMYVVVSIDGVLEWKEVVPEVTFLDSDTGELWDPLSRL